MYVCVHVHPCACVYIERKKEREICDLCEQAKIDR